MSDLKAAPSLEEKTASNSQGRTADSQTESNSTAHGSSGGGDDAGGEKTTTKHGTGRGLTLTEETADLSEREEKEAKRDTDHALAAPREDGKIELTEEAGWSASAYAWSGKKKFWVLTVIVAVQISMNFNTSVWPNAIENVSEKFHVSQQAARTTQMIFLVA